MRDDDVLWQLVLVFTPLSLLSLGGGQSVIADIGKQVVDVHGWVSQADFVDLFAISRAAPGPGSLLSTLVGWRIDGLAGALVASLAYFVPSSLIAFAVSRVWNRYRGQAWQGVLERGLAPLATGLILSGAFTVLLSSSGAVSTWLIVAASAAVFILRPKLNPLPILLAAGLAKVAVSAFS
ncbi:MAG TPA: chromate transporter [Dongiaceae bacterium]|jgi:chromate transporter|nr:chromate transporter [Dongiaceae bacterium]